MKIRTLKNSVTVSRVGIAIALVGAIPLVQSVFGVCYDQINCSTYDYCSTNHFKCEVVGTAKAFGGENKKSAYGDSETYQCGQFLTIQYHPGICDWPNGDCGGAVPKKSSSCPEEKGPE